MWQKKKMIFPKIGVALGGGGALGSAHIGVLKVFEENKIPIDYLSGNSIGAVIAALYAFEVKLDDILKLAEKMNWLKISSFVFSKRALLSNEEIGEIITEYLGEVSIEDAPIPLVIMATDIVTGKEAVLRQGTVAKAVMASTAIPGVFTPVEMDNRTLVDGLLVNNVPISPLKGMGAEFTIAVNLGARDKYPEPHDLIDILINSYEIAIDTTTALRLKSADFVLQLQLEDYAHRDSSPALELFKKGYQTTQSELPQLLKAIRRKKRKHFFLGKFITSLVPDS